MVYFTLTDKTPLLKKPNLSEENESYKKILDILPYLKNELTFKDFKNLCTTNKIIAGTIDQMNCVSCQDITIIKKDLIQKGTFKEIKAALVKQYIKKEKLKKIERISLDKEKSIALARIPCTFGTATGLFGGAFVHASASSSNSFTPVSAILAGIFTAFLISSASIIFYICFIKTCQDYRSEKEQLAHDVENPELKINANFGSP